MKLSIIIPAHNEEGCLRTTVENIVREMTVDGHDYEILVINDHSIDGTEKVLQQLAQDFPRVRYENNTAARGFGMAVRKGLESFSGGAVAIVMADGSDSPKDIVRCFEKLRAGGECVFGSRFIKGSQVRDYPWHKLMLNRLANYFIKFLFRLDYNDITNAFKCYRREVIDGLRPFLSTHFNLTVELPLKAIVRGYQYHVIPISWTNRVTGISKLKIKEMGSRYLFIVLYLFLEKSLVRKDYYRGDKPGQPG